MKLPLQEAGHEALRESLAGWDGYVSSALLGVESIRACAPYGPEYAHLARAWLEGVALLPIDEEVLDLATEIEPVGPRTLDAIHLATALTVREDIGALVTYDERLEEAARRQGLPIAAPA